MTTQLKRCTGLAAMLAAAVNCVAIAQHHGGGGLQPKPVELGGYLETKFTHYRLNRDSALYRTEFAGQPQRATLDATAATLRLTGSTRAGDWRLRFHARSTLEHDQLARDTLTRFDELAASWMPHPSFTLDAGKLVLKWGKGHTWNPVAFVERPKDTSDPRLPREGYSVMSAALTRNFTGALQSLTFSPLLLPVSENLNSDFGKHGHLNAAAKLQLDYGAADLGFYFLNNGSRPRRFGLDFSHNVTSDFEFYGEWARIKAQNFRLTTPAGTSFTRTAAATSYLVGMQYRTQRRRNFIAELHHNGTGYSADEFRDFVALVDKAAQAGANSNLTARAQTLAAGGFGRPKVMQNYLYLRASHGAVPLTPSIRMTANLHDGSYAITPELLYNVRNHWGLRARFTMLGGGAATEYGAKYYSRRAEVLLHYHF
jgi:hypothetical protein